MKIKTLTLLCFLIISQLLNAQIALVYEVENTGDTCPLPPLPEPNELSNYPFLPDPFAWSDGTGRVDTFTQWECRRNEIKAEIEHYEIGTKPNKPNNVTASFANNILTVVIIENNETLTLTSAVIIPEGDGPFIVIIGMNNPTGTLPAELFEGVIQIPFMHNQVTTYYDYAATDPFFKLYPEQNMNNTGQYAAWSWGVSRLIDGVQLIKNEIKADPKRIAVTGCSYAGKMALFAGAFDERIALTLVQESGGGGINSWRVSETIGDVEKLSNTNYDWFKDDLKTNFNNKVGSLPYDHHELMAMCLPRALFVLGNPPFTWLGDESGYVSSIATEEIYKTFGIENRFGFSFRSGHDHCQLPTESYPEVQAFVDRFLFNDTTANTNVRIHPFQSVDHKKWYEAWSIPPHPDAPTISITSPTRDTLMTAPATITILAQVSDSNGDLSKVIFYSNNEVVETLTEAPFSYSIVDAKPGIYSIYAEAIDSAGLQGYSNSININVRAETQRIFKTTTPPKINGIIEDTWNDPQIGIFKAENVLVGNDITETNLSGFTKLLWDDTFIYLLAVITDDILVNDSPAIYEDDNIEFYFDGNNAKAGSYDNDDVQYSFAWNDGTTIGLIPNNYSTDGIEYSIANSDFGYIVEAKIPWTTLQISAANEIEFGFDYMINDDDDGSGRDNKLSWNATQDDAWQDPSVFGTVKLDDSKTIVGLNDVQPMNPLIQLYPNPAAESLTIQGITNDYTYHIYNTTGKLSLSGKGQKTLNITTLPKGLYLLELVNNSKTIHLKFIKE